MALQDTNNSQLSGVDVLRNLIKAPKAVGQVVQLQPQVEQPTTLSGVELLRSTIKPPEPPKEGFADLVYTEPVEPQVEKADFRPSVMWPAKPTTPSEIDIQEYDMTKGAPILSDQLKKDFMGTLQRFWRAAERPDEILAGTAEFVSALPGFAGGIAAAIGTVPLELGDRIIKDKSFTILDLYNASARSFEKVMGDWHEYVSGPIGQVIMGPRRAGEYLSKKVVEALGGKPTEPDQGYDPGLVGEVAMAPFTAVHEPLMKLSDHPSLDDMPNVKGLIKFTTDVAALIIGGRVYKGGKDKLIKDVEPLVERAKKLADLVDQIKELESQGADASMIQAAQKVAEIQRIQANLIADEIAANMDYGQVMKEDLSSKTKRIKKIRQPDKAILDVQVDKAMQKLPDKEEVKTIEKPELGKPVPVEATVYHGSGMSLRKGKFEEGTSFSPDRSVAEAYAKNRGDIEGNTPTLYESKISFSNPKIIRNEDKVDYDWFKKAKEEGHDGVVITEGDVPVEYVVINPKAVKEFKESSTKKKVPKKEPPSELDRQTGSSDILDRSTDDHPLRNTDPKETQAKHEMYKTVKIEPGNPEIFVGKLVNDVNRWLDGDESVDITKVRGALSEMAARIGEVRDLYDNPNHFLSFRTTVDEAATWARKADRTKIKRSGELPSTQLNMMIPVDQVPKMVAQIFKDSKILMKDIFRNKELFDKTGFWYNKYDRKWVYEIDDSKVRVKPLSPEHLAYIQSGKSVKLIDVIDHPKLFEAMPKLKKTMVRVNEKVGNAYNSKSNLINVKSIDDLINPLDGSRSLLHEIGHAVREAAELKEVGSSLHLATANRVDKIFSELIVRAKTSEIAAGLDKLWKETEDYIFAGADLTSLPVYMSESIGKVLNVNSAKTFKPIKEYLDIKRVAEDYKANVGEVESKLVQKRANMTTEERRAKPPWEDMDEMMAKEGLNVKSEKKLYDIGGATVEGVRQVSDILKRVHPATFPKRIQKVIANILTELKVDDVLDIFGGTGKIGLIKDYGFTGKVIANDIEPKWGGVDTKELHKKHKVDVSIIGDARKLDIPSNSVKAIATSPTYGNLMGLKSPSKQDSYQSFAGGKLSEYNTGGEVWGPRYEQLHRESYTEAYRVIKPGGYFILNMKDKPVSAKDLKNRWVPKKGSTVKVESQVMKAVDWHIQALEDAGFDLIDRIKIPEDKHLTNTQRLSKTVGYEEVAVMGKAKLSTRKPPDTILYDIVGATIEGAKQFTELAKQLPEYTKAAKSMKKFKPKDAANMLREGFNRTFIDRAGNIRGDLLDKLGDEGYRIIQKMYGTASASSWASNLMYQMNKEINAGLTGREKSIRDNLLLAMRIKDIAKYKTPKQFHYPGKLRPEVATAYTEMFGLLEKLSPEQIALIKQSANSYIEWMKKPLNDLLEEGLITKDEYDKLASHDYRRLRKVEDIYDRQHSTKVDKRKRSVYDSGVQHLSRGHKTDILEPDSSIMALEVFNRTYGRIFNNKANKTLLDLARRDPENSFAREKKKPVGWSTIYAYEEGVRKPIYISPDMAKEWVMRDSNISYKAAAILRYASMSPVLRTFATGVNWAFATANLPRDVMHAWYAARVFQDSKWDTVYSSHMPIFAAQMAWDLGATFSDALFRKGRYVDYVKEGGGMEFLVHQGRLVRKGRHIGGSFDAIENFLGYYSETTEIMTRLAIRDRVIRTRASEQGLTLEQARKNSKITEEATFAARDYMDFNQGGWATKAADNAIPYLSAATQATRGLFRSFKPGSGTALKNTYKLAQFAAAIAASYIAIQKLSPETHNALKGNSATQDNLCIPLGDRFGFEDEHGQMGYIYFKVPLDPGQKFFKTFFEACTDKWVGNEVDVDRVTSTLKKLSPVDITALPPSMSALIGYATNKDFWRNEDIWRKTDKPAGYQLPKVLTGAPIGGSEEEHTADTPALYTDVGKYTGLSPERTKYAIEEIITKDNMWADLLIGGYELTKDLPDSKRKQHLAELLVKLPVIKRFIGITNPSDRYRDTIDEVRNKYEFERFIQNEGLDSRTDRYLFDKDVERSEILEYMKSFKDLDTFNRLKERFVFQTKTKELPNFVFWRRLQGLAPEPRAKVFAKRWDETTPQQRSQMRKEIQTVINAGGVITDDFRSELTKIRLQGLKEVEVEN